MKIKSFKKIFPLFLFLFFFIFFIWNKKKSENSPYLTIVARPLFSDGLGRLSVLLIDGLKDEFPIQFISVVPLTKSRLKDIPPNVKKIFQNSFSKAGSITIYEPPLHWENWIEKFLPRDPEIKIVYSMFETTEIPKKWVKIINETFDAVLVPDEFLVAVYKGAGVKKPIFAIPIGLYLDEFLNLNRKREANKPFIFGNLSTICDRKNTLTLIKAFHKAFGNNEDVKLLLNSRACSEGADPMVAIDEIKSLGLKNVDISFGALPWERYIMLMTKLDCYVHPSKGEGFSITPREAMALGIPAILTDNTGQSTLCNSDLVRCVPSNILEPGYFFETKTNVGCMFNCAIDDLAEAMREVYENYEIYLEKAGKAREWVKQYRFQNLKDRYLALVKPKWVELGDRDEVTDSGGLITTSEELYVKYKNLSQ